ncbi:hypothetical protein [Rhodovulum sp. P5]|uniref:hypothetical protein n=1 Tax=Rhodovulum sp. P5 TaxID=1564506 RepID=UPI0012EB71BA|nr:hypothetical protein [Rhodovulum sp. P5]
MVKRDLHSPIRMPAGLDPTVGSRKDCTMKCVFLLWIAALVLLAAGQMARAADVVLKAADLIPVGARQFVAFGLTLPEPDMTLPIVGPGNNKDGAQLLRYLNAKGAVNGFHGILYDNRDRGHSIIRPEEFPRLLFLRYGPDLKARGFDYGRAGPLVLPAAVFGNSSTAITGGDAPRSQTRQLMTSGDGPALSARLYQNNHIYIYPEHRDHDAHDTFPANWPYTVTSQGSSGTDKGFLRAFAMTLAAFPRETMDVMRKNGLVVPTLQMIMRRNLKTVSSREAYLSGAAHPTVFAQDQLRPGRMVGHANQMQPDEIPPVLQLRVEREDFAETAGLDGRSERLFDTLSAVARLWRGFEWEKELVVTASPQVNPGNRPLTYEWRLLHGNPALVEIEPQGPDGQTARIRIRWHDAFPEPVYGRPGYGDEERSRRLVSRVDIGVFANNGIHDSAPAFVSVDFPTHQRRLYTAAEDGTRRLSLIDYDATRRGQYYDPLLYWSAAWTDRPVYGADGRLTGWNRRWGDGRSAIVPVEPQADASRYRLDRSIRRNPVLVYE